MGDLPYGARVGMEPCEVRMVLRPAGSAETHTVVFDPLMGSHSDEAGCAGFVFDGEVAEVYLVPACALSVEQCTLALRHAFADGEEVLLNGYQSWTDTVERPAWARMRGLRGVPSVIIDRFALDGGGDYRFRAYSGIPGRQHGYTYATFRREEGMVLVGSLDDRAGFTEISTDASRGSVKLAAECPCGVLPAGERVVLGRYAIVRGVEDSCYDRYFELSGIAARPEIVAGIKYLPWLFGGMLFHVFCDMFTPMGIPFLWPTGPRHGLGLVYSRGLGNLALCLAGFCIAGWLAWKQYAEGTELAEAGIALFHRFLNACGLTQPSL